MCMHVCGLFPKQVIALLMCYLTVQLELSQRKLPPSVGSVTIHHIWHLTSGVASVASTSYFRVRVIVADNCRKLRSISLGYRQTERLAKTHTHADTQHGHLIRILLLSTYFASFLSSVTISLALNSTTLLSN